MRFLIPKGRWGLLGRAFLAAFIVIACAAGATTVAALLQVKTIAQGLSASPALKRTGVVIPPAGAPQTLLLIGADRRIGQSTTTVGNTDTMLLVRINDNSQTINVLSIPRDLMVTINGVTSKLNAAYATGGPKLLAQTIRQQVFPGFKYNHIVVISFLGFARLIDDIGCVYGPVDQRYYNYNDQTGDATNFSNIDLYPGYQKMCGDDAGARGALAFVRFRHFDTDEVRNARQQDFLRWAKDQFSAGYLIANRDKLAREFGKNAQTDGSLHTTDGLINLFNVLVNADGHQVKTIKFPEAFYDTPTTDYVVPTSVAAEHQAYREFMAPTIKKTVVKKKKPNKKHHHRSAFKVPSGMIANPTDGKTQAQQLGDPGIPIYYPQDIPDGYGYCFSVSANYSQNGNCDEGIEPSAAYNNSYPRRYEVQGPGHRRYKAWVMTLLDNSQGIGSGLYFNVQGLQWKNPPLLKPAHETEMVNGKKLLIYSQGGLVSTVAWEKSHAVYWIQNTLENTIPNKQMIAMAATLTPYKPSLGYGTPKPKEHKSKRR